MKQYKINHKKKPHTKFLSKTKTQQNRIKKIEISCRNYFLSPKIKKKTVRHELQLNVGHLTEIKYKRSKETTNQPKKKKLTEKK